MRWVRYETDGAEAYGLVEGNDVVAVRGNPFEGYEPTNKRRPLASVKLLVPVMPRTFYAAGLNYAEHVTAVANQRGEVPKIPKAADIGYRGNNGLIAHGDTILIPDAVPPIPRLGNLTENARSNARHGVGSPLGPLHKSV